jgi:BirA family biotin operon repressor/biotin-[acetyl-CoA-carboxylase] ligase
VKPLAFVILRQLSSQTFRSGETIARELGISRASVWQALNEIDQHGIKLFRLAGKGYRLSAPVQWLDIQDIQSALGSKADLLDIEIAESIASTNTALMKKAALGAAHGSCLIAELQTHGRGRRGRSWHATLGGSLSFSLLWRFNQGAGFLSGLSLVIGIALLRALNQLSIPGLSLKWPNDILHEQRKLAGILIELQGDMHGPCAAVIGIGINLKLPASTQAEIDQPSIDLAAIVPHLPDRNQLQALLLKHLIEVLTEFEENGFPGFQEEWIQHHHYHGQAVTLLMPDGRKEPGVVTGIAPDGSLLVEHEGKERRFNSGEISLRSAAC